MEVTAERGIGDTRRLDIGCGNTITEGFLRADIDERCPNLDFVCPMDAVPVEDGTFEEVRASHCIEHLPIEGAEKALAEWFRILESGGSVWIDTPNLRRNVELYLSPDENGWLRDFNSLTRDEQDRLMFDGWPNKTAWVNFKIFSTDANWNTHYWNADPEFLTLLCKRAGFERVEVLQTDPSLIVRGWKP